MQGREWQSGTDQDEKICGGYRRTYNRNFSD